MITRKITTPKITLSKIKNPGVRVDHRWYGHGTVIRTEGQSKIIVKFDRTDGYHGHRPVIMWAYELDECTCH